MSNTAEKPFGALTAAIANRLATRDNTDEQFEGLHTAALAVWLIRGGGQPAMEEFASDLSAALAAMDRPDLWAILLTDNDYLLRELIGGEFDVIAICSRADPNKEDVTDYSDWLARTHYLVIRLDGLVRHGSVPLGKVERNEHIAAEEVYRYSTVMETYLPDIRRFVTNSDQYGQAAPGDKIILNCMRRELAKLDDPNLDIAVRATTITWLLGILLVLMERRADLATQVARLLTDSLDNSHG